MVFEFGTFRLDEPGRILKLAGRELPLQPRVFDLLVYLVRNRARVVPKDELLDTLWPDVTVTDNSLQRAVSTLRGVLREGGMEDAVRNFSRSGYRFCVEEDCIAEVRAEAKTGFSADDYDPAARALAEQRWTDAVALFKEADVAGTLQNEDLDRWALAVQVLGKPADAIPLFRRAVAAHAGAGHYDAAANSAVALSTIHLERGEVALAKGWLARAQDLIGGRSEFSANGLFLWMQSRVALAEGDLKSALSLAGSAYDFGRTFGDVKAETLGLVYRGFYRLSLGDTRAGLQDQDHAAALALSSNMDPITGGTLYCNILWACRSFGDWARANQWTLGYKQFYTDSGLNFSGSCQLHRAEVLGIRGSLHDAVAHIDDALARLGDDAPWALGDAYRVLGDIQSAIGNSDLALTAYEKCYALGWNPEPGHALLLLERGEAAAAYASLERSLIGQSWWNLQRQGVLLAHLALVAVHAGHFERARALITDLAGEEERWPMPSIRALTNEASAVLAHHGGDVSGALRHLHLARQLWTSIDSRPHAARLRLQIAALQLECGDQNGAGTEIRAAFAAAEELDSGKLKQQCKDLQRKMT